MAINNPYYDFIKSRDLEVISLAGVVFHVNPFTYSYTTEFLDADIPTLAGYIHYSFGQKPPTHTLNGFTGNEGKKGLDKLAFLRAAAGNQQQLVTFKYPARHGQKQFLVYVRSFEDSISADMHLYNQYQIGLTDYTGSGQQYVAPVSTSIGQGLVASISNAPPPGKPLANNGLLGTS